MTTARPAMVLLAVATMGVPARAQMTLESEDRSLGYSLGAEGTGGDFISGTERPYPRDVFAFWDAEYDNYASSFPASAGYLARVRSIPTERSLLFYCDLEAGATVSDTGGAYGGRASGTVNCNQEIQFSIDSPERVRITASVSEDGGGVQTVANLRQLAPTSETVFSISSDPAAQFNATLVLQPGTYSMSARVGASHACTDWTGFGCRHSGRGQFDVTLETLCLADFDGSGILDVADFLAFQSAFDAGDALADLDGDGAFTIFDFLAFSNAFQDGCD